VRALNCERNAFRRAAAAAFVCVSLGACTQPALAAASPTEHQPVASAWPEPLPVAGPTTPQEMESFIDGFMGAQTPGAIAGATVAVVKDGALFFAKGYGYADIDKQIPVDPARTVFRVGSISKLFTWTAVMQLVEQHKVNLDADVNTYLEVFKVPATYGTPITLRNIMTHTAGFEDNGLGHLLAGTDKDLKALAEFLPAHMPARVRPPTTDFNTGAGASYSNWAAALAGYIVAKVSGESYDDYVSEHILTPLGMRRTTFREPLPADLAAEVSSAYVMRRGMLERQPFELIHNWAPAGSGSSVATDMAKFMLAYLQEGATADGRILQPETVQRMLTRTLSPDPALNGLLLGFYETWIGGRRVIGHGGDTLYFHSVVGLLPEAHLGLYVSINTGGQTALTPYALERAFFEHYFPAKLPQVKPPADAATRNERYAGSYRTLRRSYTKFEKVLSAFGDIHAVPMPDGTLLMGDPVFHTPARWVEVGEGVFRKTDEDIFIAFKGNEGGHSTAIVGPFPPIAAERIQWYETGAFLAFTVAVSSLLFITITVSAVRHRRIDRAGAQGLRRARAVLACGGVLLLLFLTGLAGVLGAGFEQLASTLPASLYGMLAFPLLALPLIVGALYFNVRLWMSSGWTLGARLHYTLATLAAVALLVVLNAWNLVGYHLG
jgi:CubicO group peptidase (beta-lactamase class C family)